MRYFPIALLLLAFPVLAENWPGYEKDNLHQNSSAVDIDPAALQLKWDAVFSNPVAIVPNDAGCFGSRNLCLINGKIALVARHNNTTGAGNRAYVTVLDVLDGSPVTVIRTDMQEGPRRDQGILGPYNYVYMEAYDTGIAITVSFWDPASGILYLSNGGDGADQTAYLPLENASDFPSAVAGGTWYVTAVPAYETLRTAHPNLEDNAGNTVAMLNAMAGGFDVHRWDLAYGFTSGSNQTGFFEVDLNGNYIVKANDSGHEQKSGFVLVAKDTGLTAHKKNGLTWMSSIEPPAYTPALTWGSWAQFKMWGACMINAGKVYFMGPGDDCDASAVLGDGGIFSGTNLVRDQGLYIGCKAFTYTDVNNNDGYTGPGTVETATQGADVWKYRYVSPNTPTNLNNAESYLEQDGFYRNKAWLLAGDTVWAAWKPTQAGNVQLIHCGPSSLNQTYDLGVGAGRRGQDIWPHISYVDLGATEKYIAYYGANAWYKVHTPAGSGADSYSGWGTDPLGTQPLGPAELAVFDADAGTLKWTYVLNAANASGPYASLPRNEATGYFDRSQMVVAGKYAYIAWVDLSATNAALKVVGFDMSSATAPATPPVPFSRDLGVTSATAGKSFVTDLIAADGAIYALITRSNVIDTCDHRWDAQQVIALNVPAAPDTTPPAVSLANVVISGTVSDNTTCPSQVLVDGTPFVVSVVGLNGTWATGNVALTSGTNDFAITATDASSNTRQVNLSITGVP